MESSSVPSPQKQEANDRLSPWTQIAYGLPGFSTTSFSTLIAIYAVDFYVSLGVRLSFLSFCTAAARSFDVLIDPFVGWISDQSATRFGRRRPFMLAGCCFYALLFCALFSPPLSDSSLRTRGAVWFGLSYTIFYFFDALTNVPYEALGPEIAEETSDRNSLFFVAKLFNLTGMLISSAAPAVVVYLLRKPKEVVLSCLALFSRGNLPRPPEDLHPLPPYFRDGEDCRRAQTCAGSYEKATPSLSSTYISVSPQMCFLENYADGHDRFLEASIEHLDQCPADGDLYQQEVLDCDDEVEGGSFVKFSAMVMSHLQAQKKAFFLIALCLSCFYVVAMINCVFVVKERQSAGRRRVHAPLLSSLYRSLHNAAFRPLLCAWAMDGLALAILTTLFPFFVRYVIVSDGVVAHRAGQGMDPLVCVSACMTSFLLGAITASFAWLRISQYFGKYRAWIAANLLSIATNLLFVFLHEGDTWLAIGMTFLNGLPVGAQFFTNSILADVIDYDEFLHGTRSEGSFSVFATMIPKFMSIPGSAYPLAIIYALGFRPPVGGISQPQPLSVQRSIQFIFVCIPLALAVLGFLCKLFFPIRDDAKLRRIHDGVAKHRRGEPAEDPLTGRRVQLPFLSDNEYRILRPFEHFSAARVRYMMTNKDTLFVQVESVLYSLIGLTASGCLGVAIFLSVPMMSERRQTFIPVTCVLLFGVTLFATLLNLARTCAAWRLGNFDFDRHHAILKTYTAALQDQTTENDKRPEICKL